MGMYSLIQSVSHLSIAIIRLFDHQFSVDLIALLREWWEVGEKQALHLLDFTFSLSLSLRSPFTACHALVT
jgi:hypothetical protein